MDAFSVSICRGLSMQKISYKGAALTALFFGAFQFIMPVIGYFAGLRFDRYISAAGSWVGFILLTAVGGKMIFEAARGEDEAEISPYSHDLWELFMLAVATSIDALAVGVVYAAQGEGIFFPAAVTGCVTFILSLCGVGIGYKSGGKFGRKAGILGGAVLVVIGIRLLIIQ